MKILQCYHGEWFPYSTMKPGTTTAEARAEVERLRSVHPGHDFRFVK